MHKNLHNFTNFSIICQFVFCYYYHNKKQEENHKKKTCSQWWRTCFMNGVRIFPPDSLLNSGFGWVFCSCLSIICIHKDIRRIYDLVNKWSVCKFVTWFPNLLPICSLVILIYYFFFAVVYNKYFRCVFYWAEFFLFFQFSCWVQ